MTFYYRKIIYSGFFLALLSSISYGAISQIIVKGKVTDAALGNPLAGVTIQLRGQKAQAITGNDGTYSISIPEGNMTGSLVFTYVGYLPQTAAINNKTTIDVQLSAEGKELETVVVSGYSRPKRKEDVVGAISSVTNRELQVDRAIESFDKMLDGLAAGVQVETNTELGTPVKINIRGQNTLTNLSGTTVRTGAFTSTQPLYVIDGVPITEQRPGDEPIQFGGEEYRNPLAGINPDDIESISVLKDAAAASVYGSNATNGVIIITTKKGKSGKPRVNVGINAGISNPINRIKWLSGPQYHTLLKELYLSEGQSPAAAEALAGSSEISTDWFGITNRTGSFQNYDMEISGGNDNSTYRMSASYMNQQSIQMGNDLQQYYFRLRLDNKLSNKLNMSTSIAPTITRKNALTVYSELTPIIPNIPVYNADSTYYTIPGVPNPIAVLDQNINQSEGGSMNGNLRLDYQLLPTLRISGNLGADILTNKQNTYLSALNATGSNFGGRATIYDRTNFSWIGFTQASWAPKLKEGQKLDVLAGFEARSELTKLLRGSGTGFTYYRLNELSNARQQTSASSQQKTNSYSIYTQASFSLHDKYYVTASARQDASSIFGTDVSTTLNGALGLGWTLSREAFLKQTEWINLLRLRVSYGTTGNSRIGSYEARGLYNIGNSGYNGQSSSDPVSLPNPDLGWEKGYKTNIGIDFNILRRVFIDFNWYNNIVDDAISTVEIPYETGFAQMLANTSKMQNRGWDASIRVNVLKGTVNWNTTLNMGYNKNEVLEVRNGGQRFAGLSENAAALRAGAPTTAIWGFNIAGMDPQTGVLLYRMGDGKVVRGDDRTVDFGIENSYIIGDRLPDLTGGFINDFSFKGLTLNILFTYSWGNDQLVNYRNEWNGNNLDNRNQSVNLVDRWQKPGDVTTIPKLNRPARSGIRFVPNSSQYLYDASFIKLNNVALSYLLPAKWAKAIKASRISVFANASNLWYWYKNDSPDGRNGIRQYRFSFPEAQSITGGVKFGW